MAASAPVAVVVRRGPSSWAGLVLWDTARDEFTEGAWFHGRIFADKCDLSPDGSLFVYAAYQGYRLKTRSTDSWTAVSRPPWLHALALWPMGTTYGGGGRFVDNRRLIVRSVTSPHLEHSSRELQVVVGAAERHASTNEVDGAEWSGRDHDNRLVFAARGRIFARTGMRDVELADFTTQHPDPRPPPDWAKLPLR